MSKECSSIRGKDSYQSKRLLKREKSHLKWTEWKSLYFVETDQNGQRGHHQYRRKHQNCAPGAEEGVRLWKKIQRHVWSFP